MQVVADALYYNAALTLSILHRLGVATEIFTLWFQMLEQVKKSGVRANFKRATLDLLVQYKDQLAEAAKEEEAEDLDEMDGFQTDDEDDDAESDKEMGVDAEDGDEAESIKLQKLAAQAKSFRPHDVQTTMTQMMTIVTMKSCNPPIDEVDPFIFFVDTIKAMQASDPLRFQNLTQTLDFHFQALANGVAEHAEQRRVVIEKEKLEKASTAGAS
ncbi:hypothetical protein NC652_007754 [Populus alba x Populus x berolinensis]|nr:hypothetical protein NC652_007754 [Populus alba x Populus x berolinensis]